jgi:hypothetical protein
VQCSVSTADPAILRKAKVEEYAEKKGVFLV